MKILSCYINNFGILSDREFTFGSGLNEICEDNGWGKSTLTTFIRVMLYGFENEAAKSKSQRERHAFKPWQGGVYGGVLNIEVGNARYSISRTFGDKVSEDILEVRDLDTNIVTDELGSNIGETIFQLDSASFMRTSFISQSDCGTQVGSSINAKLGNLTDNTDDINRYEEVDNRINSILNSLTPDRKTGLIKSLKMEISEKEASIRDKEMLERTSASISDKLLELRGKLYEIKDEQNYISQELTKESEYQDIKVLREKYESLIKNLTAREQELADARHAFPNDVPSSAEMEEKQDICSEILSIRGEYNQLVLSEDEMKLLKQLEKYFGGKVPSDQELGKAYDDLSIIESLRDDIDRKQMPSDNVKRYKELGIKLGGNIPNVDELDELLSNLSTRIDKVQEIKQKQSQLDIYVEEQKKKEKSQREKNSQNSKFAFLIGAIMLVMGVVLFILFYNKNNTHYVAALPAIVGLAMILFGFRRGPKVDKDGRIARLEQEIKEDQEFVNLIGRDLDAFKKRYDWDYDSAQISYSLIDMKRAILEYQDLKKEKELDHTEPLKDRCQRIKKELADFVKRYEPELAVSEDRIVQAIPVIENKKQEYIRLRNQNDKSVTLLERLEVKEKKLSAFLLSSGYRSGDMVKNLADMSDKLSVYLMAKREAKRASVEKEAFEKDYPEYENLLTINDPNEDNTITSLNDRRLYLEGEEASTKVKIDEYERQLLEKQDKLQSLYEKEAELEQLYDKLNKAIDEYNMYSLTRDYLARAKENLTNRYTKPIMKSFSKHLMTLTGKNSDGYYLDANIRMTKSEYGMQREIERMSRGQQDLVGICMRMALVDAMYGEEKPFIIFDDPFTNFDSVKTRNGMDFVRKLAEEYQILYFTCHESRRSKKP